MGQELGDGLAGQLISAPHIITLRSSAGTGESESRVAHSQCSKVIAGCSLGEVRAGCWLGAQ